MNSSQEDLYFTTAHNVDSESDFVMDSAVANKSVISFKACRSPTTSCVSAPVRQRAPVRAGRSGYKILPGGQGRGPMLRRQRDGEVFILQRAVSGTPVAEASLFSTYYHCAAVAVGETEVDVWKHQQVPALIENNAPAALAYAQNLAEAVRQARIHSEIVSLRRVADRLDAWLAWHDGQLPARGSWAQVAREIAVAPEALYRELACRRRQAGSR